ncbi:hypothetical protein SCLCIDRAFT_442813 [Scleroderma citrinum Foug A]|uniref:Uncharacterized protein n=1 Tax=Scleroderma citrinum Foug A TaxID=1036808 RepID=A0A0C3EBG0_9AGAM|nr:hypothetical protein SCLCIDRAFT_442813 [Scleroderma citrinum Foug A]
MARPLTLEPTIARITLNPNHDVPSLSKLVDPSSQKTQYVDAYPPQCTLVPNAAVTMDPSAFRGNNSPSEIFPGKRGL